MQELRRRSYLEAMGVESYLSRQPLPGAAPSRKLMVVRRPVVSRVPSAEIVRPRIVVDDEPQCSSASQGQGVKPAVATGPQAEPSPGVASPAVQFSMAAVMTGKWLWLEELPAQQALMQDQVRLIQAMAFALGWADGQPDVAQFNWPFHKNTQLDLGEEAARAGLSGFVSRKMESRGCTGIILLGDRARHWVPQEHIGAWCSAATVATREMLQDPGLKKQAWGELKPLAL